MNKKIVNVFGKDNYFLGVNQDGENVWLVKPSWDCGWYWGFGYLETYTNNEYPERSKDISTHTHFDSQILNGKSNAYDNFKNYFVATPLNDDEIWLICDYMQTFYTLKETAETLRHGYSWLTGRAKIDEIQREDIAETINKVMMPKLFEKIGELLSPKMED